MDDDRMLPSWLGVLGHIHVSAGASVPMEPRLLSEVLAGVGIPGDRYAMRTGMYSDRHHIAEAVAHDQIGISSVWVKVRSG